MVHSAGLSAPQPPALSETFFPDPGSSLLTTPPSPFLCALQGTEVPPRAAVWTQTGVRLGVSGRAGAEHRSKPWRAGDRPSFSHQPKQQEKGDQPLFTTSLINEAFYPKSSFMNYAGFWERNQSLIV